VRRLVALQRDYLDDEVAPLLDRAICPIGHLEPAAVAAMFGRVSVLLFTPQ